MGDPVILIFTNGARGFLALPKPLFGSECDDNNAAGILLLAVPSAIKINNAWDYIRFTWTLLPKQTST